MVSTATPLTPSTRSTVSTASTREPRARTARPIVVWAIIGAGFVALAMYVAASWILGGRATPTPIGVTDPSTRDIAFAIFFQATTLIAVIGTIIYVARRCVRERRLTFDAMLIIAYLLFIQWDPAIDYLVPQFSYSALLVNFGSWTTDIPGWVSPHANLMPEPTILIGIGFIWSVAIVIMGCNFLQNFVMRRWPNTGVLGIIAWSVGIMVAFDLGNEMFGTWAHLFAYPVTVSWLTLFKGTSHQFPIYESIVWGGLGWAPLMVLRFYRDDRGLSVVERGVDRLRIGTKRKVVLQILALAAVTNICYFSYSAIFSWIGTQADNDASKVYPSYLINGMCGTGDHCWTAGHPLPTGGAHGKTSDIPGDGRTWWNVYFGGTPRKTTAVKCSTGTTPDRSASNCAP